MSRMSKSQIAILDKMRDGWCLGRGVSSINKGCWLQQGGLGKGGTTERVLAVSVDALERAGRIVRGQGYPTVEYSLVVAPNE